MTLMDSLQTLPTVFTLGTMPLYIKYLITLHKNRKEETLKFPFFKLMFSIGIADVGLIVVLILGNTLAGAGWVPEVYIFLGGLSARMYNAGIFSFGLVQNIGVFVVAVNRFTAYMRPMKHSKWKDVTERKIYSIVTSGLLSGGLAVIIVIIYAIIFVSAFIRKIRSQQPMTTVEKTALKMAVTGFICSIGLLINIVDIYVNLGAWYLFGVNFPDVATFWLIFNVGNSIYAAVNPYAMFLFSSAVRHRFAALYCTSWHPHGEQAGGLSRNVVNVQPMINNQRSQNNSVATVNNPAVKTTR